MVYIKYFLRKKRTYLSLICIIAMIGNLIGGDVASAFFCLIIAVAILFMPIVYLLTDARAYCIEWLPNQEYRAAQDRINKAAKGDVDPIVVEKEVKTGYYYGKNGETYETTLMGCTCMDYRKSHIPCKHMYHLAHSLGAITFAQKPKEEANI